MLHVFDEVCNLIDKNAEVMSLVTPQIGDGPFNLVVPPVRFSDYVAPADQVMCDQNALTAGALEIDIAAAPIWNPCPPWETLREKRDLFRCYMPLLADVLREIAPADSLAGLLVDLPEPASAVEAAMLHAAREPVNRLIRGLRRRDQRSCLEGVIGLAGLGGGLTPAGDDWIVGCVLASWAGLPNEERQPTQHGHDVGAVLASPRAEQVPSLAAHAAARCTTPLSAAWLRAAARGECSALWHSLFEGMLAEDEPAICEAAQKIAWQGHTSGADALAGFVATLTRMRPGVLVNQLHQRDK